MDAPASVEEALEGAEGLAARARKEVDDGLLPSCQWALALDGEVIAGATVGEVPAGESSRYIIYS